MRLFSTITKTIGSQTSPGLYSAFINVRNRLRGKLHAINPTSYEHIYRITDGADELYICRRIRHNRYKRGISAGVNALAGVYHLDSIDTSAGGLLLDCGANVGELGVWARANGLEYIAFEPEELESQCCDLNNYTGNKRTHKKALWCENTTLRFFRKPDSADSSVIEIQQFEEVREVEAVRLDNVVGDIEDNGVIVLKIEAEGAEPEVLEGAAGILSQVDYVAIDCGYERGVDKKHTFVETSNFLVDRGFRVEQAHFERVTVLYRNTLK